MRCKPVKAGHIESALKSSLLPAPTTQGYQIGDLVSREPELAQLQQAWQLAGQGQGTVALIEAEAGSGKTRLAREFGHSLPGARFLSGECYESTRTLPYYPWLDLLETHLANLDEASLNRLSPFWLDYLLRLLPGLAGRLGRTVPPAPAAGEGEIEHLFAAVTELLFHLPQPQPLLIFIDNLQWADEASLRLFHFVARRIRRAKALLLGAFRAEEVHDAPALQTLLEDLRRNALLHLRLPPLNLEAVALLTAQLWPNLPGEARPRVCAMLAESTGGNALFVTQVLTELAHTAAAPASLPVPESVRDLIRHRLRRLPESSQQVIEAIGVIGWPVTPSQAQQVSGRTEEETIVAIDWGLRWGLLELQEGALPSQYGFSHDLVREAVISQLSDIRRWLLHRRTAALLIQTAGLARPAQRRELAGRITHHALPGEDFGLVAVWAPLAAEHARSVGAYADALAAYEVAQTALAHLSPGAHPDPSSELTLTLNQIEMLHLLGRRAEETTLLQSVVGLLKQQPQAQLQASFYLRQALCLEALSDYESAAETARQAYQSYMQLGDSHDAARCLYLSGVNRLRVGQNEAGRSLLEQALELYRANGELSGENLCLTALAVYAINFAQIETALALMARALEIVTQQGDLPGRARACYITGLAWTFYYRADKIRSFAQEVRALGLELGETALVAKSLLLLAASYRVEGQLVEAQTLYEQAFNEAQQSQDNWLAGWSAQVLGRLALGQRDLPAAARWFQHAYQIRREHGQAQNQLNDLAWMGRLRLAQGQPAEALSYTTEAVEHMELLWGQVYVFERWDVFMAHAEALAVAGQQAAALTYVQRAYEALLKFAHQISDATTKRHFLATYLSSRIVNAYNSGQIRPFPD
ncbi:MAG: AAA family ATPase [Anaerolineae bacterium]